MATECPWQRHWDESSNSYFYFNLDTEESLWEVPAGWESHFADEEQAADPPKAESESSEQDTQEHELPIANAEEATQDAEEEGEIDRIEEDESNEVQDFRDDTIAPDVAPSTPPSPPAPEEDPEGLEEEADSHIEDEEEKTCLWIKAQDEEGTEYYYNTLTEESRWDEPEEYTRFHDKSSHEMDGVHYTPEDGPTTPDHDDQPSPESPGESTTPVDENSTSEPPPAFAPDEQSGTPSSASSTESRTSKRHSSSTPLGFSSSGSITSHGASLGKRSRSPAPGAMSKSPSLSPGFAVDSKVPSPALYEDDEDGSPSLPASPGGLSTDVHLTEHRGAAGVRHDPMETMSDGDEGLDDDPASGMAMTPADEDALESGTKDGANAPVGISQEQRVAKAEQDVISLERRVGCM